jgi:UDP-N-acetylmuramate dehydrogenase
VRCYFLGNGSNTLFSDEGYRGAVLDLSAMEEALSVTENVITASAGCSLMRLCRFAAQNGLSGLEFACGIPGTVGGAVYMNAGAYGGETRDVLVSVRALEPDGTVRTLPVSALELRYRHSVFSENGACVLSAAFALQKGDPAAITAKMEELLARRRDKQPLDKPSAGSTFKRPEGAYAAALIDQCGLRGYQVGGAAISEKHCGFVVNLGGATCADVEHLCEQVAAVVREKTGFSLEKEIRVVK